VEGRLLLDVVVSQGAAVLQLLAGENEALLVRRDACMNDAQQSARMNKPYMSIGKHS